MPKTSQQNQDIRAATRAKLLRSAMLLYAEHGYAHTSIRKIAAHAGVSVGLLYHYFDDKEALLQAVFDDCMRIISAGFAGIDERSEPLEKVDFLLVSIFATLRADPTFWGLFYSLRAQPAVDNVLGNSVRMWTGRLRDLFITFLQQAGYPQPKLSALLLYSLIEGTIQQYLLDPENYPLEIVAARIRALTAAGF